MRDWTTGGAIKIKRAKENINDLARRIDAFRKTVPYLFIIEPDTKRGGSVGRIEVRGHVDPIWGAIAGDAIHNLRSVLDILFKRATRRRHKRSDNRTHIYYPFWGADELKARARTEKESIVKRAWELALETAPYEGGNDLLCFVNAADLCDKHEVPTLVATRMGALGEPSWNFATNVFTLRYAGDMSTAPPLEHSHQVWHNPNLYPTTPEAKTESEIAFEVTFGKEGPFNGQPVLHQLTACAQEVESVVEAFLAAGLLD